VRYLLDVNALLALGHTGHSLHSKAIRWYQSVLKAAAGLHTCSITELGFVRVSVATGLQPDIEAAKKGLDALRSSSKIRFELIPDDLSAAQLPAFVKKPQAVTDGHLLELARKNSLRLVTLDKGIPGALYIG
jgi:predicted nucleic acid-binding protein